MTRRWYWGGMIVVFGLGVLIGTHCDIGKLHAPAEANTLTVQEANRVYQQLGDSDHPLEQGSRRLAQIAGVTTPSVVHIQARRTNGSTAVEETGSGVIVNHGESPELYVVTNRHVIAEARREDIAIRLYDGRVVHPLRVWADAESDIAVLRIAERNLPTARWGDSDRVEIGDMVLALGSPFGLSRSVTFGIISAKGRRSLELGEEGAMLNQDFLQTDAAINPGNSGGPLIDLNGRVIGINTAIASNSGGNDGIGFSIPANLVQQVVDELITRGQVRRAYLGVKLDPDFTQETASRLNLERPRGARVMQVLSNTPADRARLLVDDVILSFNGREVQDGDHLVNLVSLTPVGSRVRMIVIRDARRVTLTVLLADRREMLRQQSQTSTQNSNRPRSPRPRR